LINQSVESVHRGRIGNNRRSDAETAYLRLRDMVVTGVLPPGLVINEQEFVARLEIGRTPVREAVQRLAGEGMLTIFPRRGIAVSKVGLSDIQAIFEAREAVEVKLASLAALRRTDEEADAIVELGERLKAAAASQEYRRFLAEDHEFHRLIANTARSRFLEETCDHVLILSEWVWHQFFMLNGSHPSDFFGHDDIIQAIVDRDAERACHEMAKHLHRSRDLVRSTM
jgi:DNA-binding GntR family transcriptional regulator